jgi:hypothetical protein
VAFLCAISVDLVDHALVNTISTVQLIALLGGAVILIAGVALWIWWSKARGAPNLSTTIRDISLDSCESFLIPDINGGTIYIDCLLLTPACLLLLDLNETTGAVIAGDKLNQWTVSTRDQTYTIDNPVQRLLDQTAALSLVAPGADVKTLVVFTQDANFPKGHPENVITLDQLQDQYRLPPEIHASEVYARHWESIKATAIPA